MFRSFFVCAGIVGDVEAGDADAACGADDGHERVEDGCGGFRAVLALGLGFEADGVDRCVYFGFADDGLDEIAEVVAFGEIDWNETYAGCVFEAVGVHIADHDDGRAEDLGCGCGCETYRACAGDVDNGADANACGDGSVKARGEDVGEHGEVFDLRHGLCSVGESDEVEGGVGDHDEFCLTADPAAHIDVAVGSAGAAGVNVEADSGLLVAAGATAAAGDVEGDGDKVAHAEVFDVGAGLDNFAGNLVSENHAGGCGGAATDHVLVGAADICRDDLQDDAVVDLFSGGILQFGEVNGLDFYFVLSEKNYSSVFSHFFLNLVALDGLIVRFW